MEDIIVTTVLIILGALIGYILNIACALFIEDQISSRPIRTTVAIATWIPYLAAIITLIMFLYEASKDLFEEA